MKVLMAEDDRDFGNILSQYISISGYDVTLARDGKEAWELFEKEKPDLCVLDVMMPEMDGFTLAEEIKESRPEIPIIFLTAKSLKEDMFLAVFEGVPLHEVKEIHNERGVLDFLTDDTGVFSSKGELRRMIQGGGLSINKEKVDNESRIITKNDFLNDKYVLVQKGKKNYFLIRLLS